MPYFIYRITTGEQKSARNVTYLNEFEGFRDARKDVKQMRLDQAADDSGTYKVIFAKDQAEAEKLLLEYREEPVIKEWEK
jgi:hypothetical protein